MEEINRNKTITQNLPYTEPAYAGSASTWSIAAFLSDSLIELGDDDDFYEVSGTNNSVHGGDGNDTITSDGFGYLHGGEGDDILTIIFNGVDDTMILRGEDGNDLLRVISESGRAYSLGGKGDDTLHGDTGNDLLGGEEGEDDIYGGEGDDTLGGGEGRDLLIGEEGKDSLSGGEGDDILYGSEGHDTLVGGMGADMLHGGAESATASYPNDTTGIHIDLGYNGPQSGGEAEGDRLINIRGIIGSPTDDMIIGTDGNHTLNGSWGDDTLDGGAHADLLTGGAGMDIFRFSSLEHSRFPYDSDRITDFQDGIDLFDLTGLGFTHFTTNTATNAGELRAEYNHGQTFILSDQSDFGFRLNKDFTMELSDADFIF